MRSIVLSGDEVAHRVFMSGFFGHQSPPIGFTIYISASKQVCQRVSDPAERRRRGHRRRGAPESRRPHRPSPYMRVLAVAEA
ncbi:MAG: hypothetical protein QF878_02705 [SAR202 cluster bacterium]|nr:hypothetical protein [SAR202 cluster bacterium]MDP6716859.1 hypothetical protein [SAR202 cluster bacterium]